MGLSWRRPGVLQHDATAHWLEAVLAWQSCRASLLTWLPLLPACCIHTQRDATAAIARRQQWQTVPMEDAPRTLQVATQEPCNEVRAPILHAAADFAACPDPPRPG